MDKRRYIIGDLIDNKYGPELQILDIDDDSGKTDSCYKTICTKCDYIIEKMPDFLEKLKVCPNCGEKPAALKTDDDGMSTVQQNSESHNKDLCPTKAADLDGEGGDAMQIIEKQVDKSGSAKKEKLSGAVAKHTPDNKTSNNTSTTNLGENYTMKKPQKPNMKALLSNAAIKPGDIPKIKYDKKQTVMKASGSIPKNTFFRAHQDHESQFMMVQAGKEMDAKMYIISSELIMPAHLKESTVHIVCHLIIFPDGDCRILERKTAFPGEPLNEYQQSSFNVVEAAKKGWVMRQWNRSSGVYDHVEAAAGYAPEPPWPKEEFMELLTKAYDGRIIDSVDHPIYLELAGKRAISD